MIETGGRLRVWEDDLDSEQRTRWYRDRFVPTLRPLLDLGPERVLVTRRVSGGAGRTTTVFAGKSGQHIEHVTFASRRGE